VHLFDPFTGATVGRLDRITVTIEDDENVGTPPAIDRVAPTPFRVPQMPNCSQSTETDFVSGANSCSAI